MSIATVPPALLLARLEAIGVTLSRRPDALGLIALGSAELDAYSDLDFYIVVKADARLRYLEHLDWLEAAGPGTEGTARSASAYRFRNTVDGYKLLYADGVFCEFAVFTPQELAAAQGSGARIIWARPGVAVPLPQPPPPADQPDLAWQVGEALTNLYVGLGRYKRGERLSAARFIPGRPALTGATGCFGFPRSLRWDSSGV